MNYKISLSILLLFIFVGCTSTTNKKRVNFAEDIKVGKEFTENVFYPQVKSKKFDEISIRFDEDLSPTEGKRILLQADSVLGNLKSYKCRNARSSVISGTTNEARYELDYETVYENGNATELVVLKNINDSLKIIGYHINLR